MKTIIKASAVIFCLSAALHSSITYAIPISPDVLDIKDSSFDAFDIPDALDIKDSRPGVLDIKDSSFGARDFIGFKPDLSPGSILKEIHKKEPVSPIPEADTYAMMLAGLGLVGFMVYRRRNS